MAKRYKMVTRLSGRPWRIANYLPCVCARAPVYMSPGLCIYTPIYIGNIYIYIHRIVRSGCSFYGPNNRDRFMQISTITHPLSTAFPIACAPLDNLPLPPIFPARDFTPRSSHCFSALFFPSSNKVRRPFVSAPGLFTPKRYIFRLTDPSFTTAPLVGSRARTVTTGAAAVFARSFRGRKSTTTSCQERSPKKKKKKNNARLYSSLASAGVML